MVYEQTFKSGLIVVLLFSCVTGKEFKQHIKPSIPWLFLLWVGLTFGFKPKINVSIVKEKYEVRQSIWAGVLAQR